MKKLGTVSTTWRSRPRSASVEALLGRAVRQDRDIDPAGVEAALGRRGIEVARVHQQTVDPFDDVPDGRRQLDRAGSGRQPSRVRNEQRVLQQLAQAALAHRAQVWRHSGYLLTTPLILFESPFGRMVANYVPGLTIDGPADFDRILPMILGSMGIELVIIAVIWARHRERAKPFLVGAVLTGLGLGALTSWTGWRAGKQAAMAGRSIAASSERPRGKFGRKSSAKGVA